jgi:hypothetical protein
VFAIWNVAAWCGRFPISQELCVPNSKKQPNTQGEAPEAAELSDEALESVAGGCQIGDSVAENPLKTTVEPTVKFPIGLEGIAREELF